MKLLLDECVPRKLAAYLEGVDCSTVPRQGWSGYDDEHLLDSAEREFDFLLTTDRSIAAQQNLRGRRIGIIILAASNNTIEALAPLASGVIDAASPSNCGRVIKIGA